MSTNEHWIGMGATLVVRIGWRIWFRTYTEGGYDGYRTLTGRRVPCDTLARMWADRND